MSMIIDQNSTFQKFNFGSLITGQDNRSAITIIDQIIDSGNYFKNSPRYQTKENLFARPEPIWLKYRMSFLFSVFLYLGKEVKVSELMAWSFRTNLSFAEDREKLWHNHWHPVNPGGKMISGIFYLHIPDDVSNIETAGTEMAPGGLENSQRVFVKPEMFSWLIYPGEIWHRPGIVQSYKNRYVLAADVEYL